MTRIDYRKIRRTLIADLAALRANSRATVRTLDESDVDEVIDALKRARRKAPDADGWTVVCYGGVVASSYRYKAEGDRIYVVADSDGFVSAKASRTHAPKRAHSRGDCLVARALVKSGAGSARIVLSY